MTADRDAQPPPPASTELPTVELIRERERVAGALNARVITRTHKMGLHIAALIEAYPALREALYLLLDDTDAIIRDTRLIAFGQLDEPPGP